MATAHVNVKGRTSMDGRGWAAGLRKMEVGTKGAAARMAGSMAGMIGGVFAVGFLASATRRIVQHADQIHKTAVRIGASTDTIQKFDFAATQSGASMGDVEKAFINTAKAMESANQGLTTHIRAFEAFGITMQMLNVMSPEQVFLKVADAIEKAGGAMDKAKSLQDIMGRGGKAMIPAFVSGFTGLAGSAPDPISEENIQNLVRFNDELDRLKREALPIAVSAVSGIADKFSELGEAWAGIKSIFVDPSPGVGSSGVEVWENAVGKAHQKTFKQVGAADPRATAILSRFGPGAKKETDPETADAAAAAAAKAWSKPSLQLNSLQRIGAAVSQSADPIAIEKNNNTLLKAIAKNTKKTADETDQL